MFSRTFSLDHLDDYQKHFTVMNYSEAAELKQVPVVVVVVLLCRIFQATVMKMMKDCSNRSGRRPTVRGRALESWCLPQRLEMKKVLEAPPPRG